jgi:molybdate transport system permease protein
MTWTPLSLSLWVSTWASLLALLFGTADRLGAGQSLLSRQVGCRRADYGAARPAADFARLLPADSSARPARNWPLGRAGFRHPHRFSPWAAIIAATIAALPLVIQTVQVSIASLSREVDEAGQLDGCTHWGLFRYIHLPLIWRGLLAGWVLGFLRALGDFGATLMVAGNIPGRTQTMSMAIYDAVQPTTCHAPTNWP